MSLNIDKNIGEFWINPGTEYEPKASIQFIDLPIGVDSGRSLRDPTAINQAGLTGIPGARVNLHLSIIVAHSKSVAKVSTRCEPSCPRIQATQSSPLPPLKLCHRQTCVAGSDDVYSAGTSEMAEIYRGDTRGTHIEFLCQKSCFSRPR